MPSLAESQTIQNRLTNAQILPGESHTGPSRTVMGPGSQGISSSLIRSHPVSKVRAGIPLSPVSLISRASHPLQKCWQGQGSLVSRSQPYQKCWQGQHFLVSRGSHPYQKSGGRDNTFLSQEGLVCTKSVGRDSIFWSEQDAESRRVSNDPEWTGE